MFIKSQTPLGSKAKVHINDILVSFHILVMKYSYVTICLCIRLIVWWCTSSTSTTSSSQFSDEADEIYVYETDAESKEDCTSYEAYDGAKKVCYYTCENKQTCQQAQDAIDAELETWSESLSDQDRKKEAHLWQDTQITNSLARYHVDTKKHITLKTGSTSHQFEQIRSEIAELIPNQIVSYIESFEIFDNPTDDTSAFVIDDDLDGKWHIAINLTTHLEGDLKEQKATLIHELAHIITLNTDQMITQTPCRQYETQEWCTKSSSYLNHFYHTFRKNKPNHYESWMFVTEYASTSIEEDIAESFAFFVLESNHQHHINIKDKKISFFYQYPELVQIRNYMRKILSTYAIRLKKSHNFLNKK